MKGDAADPADLTQAGLEKDRGNHHLVVHGVMGSGE